MKQDHWIDLNIHQLKYNENEKKTSKRERNTSDSTNITERV